VNGFLLLAETQGPEGLPLTVPLSLHATLDEALRAGSEIDFTPDLWAERVRLPPGWRGEGAPWCAQVVEFQAGEPVKRWVVREVDGKPLGFLLGDDPEGEDEPPDFPP
jgi:hypothetical protein